MAPRTKPFVSIIMPALNEELHIRDAVTSVLPDAEVVDYEIMVADGGSTDRTCNIVLEIAGTNPRVRLIHNSKRIQSAGVNLGAVSAHPEAQYMLRADCHFHYPKGFAERCVATLEEHCVASVVVPMLTVGSTCMQEAFAAAQNSRLGNGGSAHRSLGKSGLVEHGHHAAFRRDVFLKLGGYDESFTHNEDAEFDRRLVMLGERIYLNSDLAVTYFPRTSFKSLARQYWWHGWGRAGTMIKHAIIPRLRQVLPPIVLLVCLTAALLSLLDARFLAVPAIYVTACIAWGLALAVKNRRICLAASGVAAMVMHMSWASGFLTKVWRSRSDILARRRRQTRSALDQRDDAIAGNDSASKHRSGV
jgi:succinoglycan biosynthesis protein ExoA